MLPEDTMRITCRFFILLSIFHCTGLFSRAAHIDEHNNNLWTASKGINDRRVELKGEEEATGETTASSNVEASRRSLAIPGFAFLASPTITRRSVKSQRRKRNAATDDGPAAGFVTYDVVNEDEESWRKQRVLSTHGGHPKTKRGKHRGRHRCKSYYGCSRSGHRRNNKNKNKKNRNKNKKDREKMRINKLLKQQRSFQHQQSRNNENFERRLLVGNRSLALFREELAAAAAAAAAAANSAKAITTSRNLVDRLNDTRPKEIGDVFADTRSQRKHASTKLFVPKISSKYKNKLKNRTVSRAIDETTRKTKSRQVERDKISTTNPMTSKVISDKNKFHDPAEPSSLIDDYNSRKDRTNFTNNDDGRKNEFENETDSNFSGNKEIKDETRITIESEESNDDFLTSIYLPNDDRIVIHESLIELLSRLFNALKNSTKLGEKNVSLRNLNDGINSLSNNSNEIDNDLCQKWLDSKDKLEEAFIGPLVYLPSCPCQYSSSISQDDKIWDERQKKFYRWHDVSGESANLNIYKPGATYCMRSLLALGSGHAVAQHCCYDRKMRLLTRGPGAGIPNFLSPEISSKLHERIDILPWRLCKGDFTRFNGVRMPNNDNRCETNPEDEEYQRQINKTKYHR